MLDGAELVLGGGQVCGGEHARDAGHGEGGRHVNGQHSCVRARAQHGREVQLAFLGADVIAVDGLPGGLLVGGLVHDRFAHEVRLGLRAGYLQRT